MGTPHPVTYPAWRDMQCIKCGKVIPKGEPFRYAGRHDKTTGVTPLAHDVCPVRDDAVQK